MRHTQNPQPMQRNLGSSFLCNNLSKTSALRRLSSQSFSRLALILARLGLILGFALATAGTAAAQVAPPVGPYGFVLNATFTDASTQGGAAMLGLMNFDGTGNVSGPYQLELGSGGANAPQSISGSFTGTYSSNPVPPFPDGSGTITLALDIGVNLTLTTLIDNRGRTIQLGLTGCTGPICDLTRTVVSGVAEIEFNSRVHPIDAQFLDGSYGLQTTKSSPIPATTLQVWTFNSALGTVTLSGTLVGPGPVVVTETLSGTYSVNPDGTGTITIPPQNGSPGTHTWVFVITGGHSGLLVLQTHRAGDGVMYGTGQIQ
jgi:hypothetical protein